MTVSLSCDEHDCRLLIKINNVFLIRHYQYNLFAVILGFQKFCCVLLTYTYPEDISRGEIENNSNIGQCYVLKSYIN